MHGQDGLNGRNGASQRRRDGVGLATPASSVDVATSRDRGTQHRAPQPGELTPADALTQPTHVIVSSVLRYSLTFSLYRQAFSSLGVEHTYVPHELPLLDGLPDIEGLAALLTVVRETDALETVVISDPYKQVVIPFLDQLTQQADRCGAVNLVMKVDGKLVGDNLDGRAFRLGVDNELGLSFKRQNMVFFGCGGVSSAIASELASELSRVALIDISQDRAEELRDRLMRFQPKLRIDVFDRSSELDLRRYQYFYNGTGLGKFSQNENASLLMPLHLFDQLPDSGIAFDANYTPWETAFLRRLSSLGFVTTNGFSHMLAFVSLHLSAILNRDITFPMVQTWADQIETSMPAPWF